MSLGKGIVRKKKKNTTQFLNQAFIEGGGGGGKEERGKRKVLSSRVLIFSWERQRAISSGFTDGFPTRTSVDNVSVVSRFCTNTVAPTADHLRSQTHLPYLPLRLVAAGGGGRLLFSSFFFLKRLNLTFMLVFYSR